MFNITINPNKDVSIQVCKENHLFVVCITEGAFSVTLSNIPSSTFNRIKDWSEGSLGSTLDPLIFTPHKNYLVSIYRKEEDSDLDLMYVDVEYSTSIGSMKLSFTVNRYKLIAWTQFFIYNT